MGCITYTLSIPQISYEKAPLTTFLIPFASRVLNLTSTQQANIAVKAIGNEAICIVFVDYEPLNSMHFAPFELSNKTIG